MLDVEGIKEIIPHRDPFLLVDEITELEPGKKAIGIKRLTGAESFFAGHFPGNPVTPGVLLVEALAQVGAVAILSLPENRGKIPFFAGIDAVRFRKPVLPGSAVELRVEIVRSRGPVGKGKGMAYVDGELVAEGDLTFAVR